MMSKILERNAWVLEEPGGVKYIHNERTVRSWAKQLSSKRPGRYVCRRAGCDTTVMSSHQYMYVYEGGVIVDRGKVDPFARALAGVLTADHGRAE